MSKRATAGFFASIVAVTFALAGIAAAAEVTLRAKNGDFQIKGELISYENNKYTIMSSSLGSMSLDASRFDCVSGSCPNDTVAMRVEPTAAAAPAGSASVSISGSNTIGNQLMPNLIEAYADLTKTKLTKVVSADALDLEFRMSGQDGHDEALSPCIGTDPPRPLWIWKRNCPRSEWHHVRSNPMKFKNFPLAGLGDVRSQGSEHVLGLDGLLVLVSPKNPIVSLPTDSIAKIFSGQITDWSQLGQPAGKIDVYAPTPDSGTFDTFDNLVLKPNKLALSPNAKRTPNHAEQSDWVAPRSDGHRLYGHRLSEKRQGAEHRLDLWPHRAAVDVQHQDRGIPSLTATVLYTSGAPQDRVARGLLAFALSPDAQPIVKQSDFIDQVPETASYESQAGRLAFALNAPPENFDQSLMSTFIYDIKSAQRLSVTFRFQSGSYQLDNKALADVKRLVDLLKSDAYKNKSILLAGFADTKGTFANNLLLSRHRAKAVLSVMKAEGLPLGPDQITDKGYSELAPAACNDSDEGMQLNRRVEVWIN